MKVSTLIELLLIFLIIAFAAGRVIDVSQVDLSQPRLSEAEVSPLTAESIKELSHYVDEDVTVSRAGRSLVRQQRQGPPNRYCACTSLMCNCCRDFSLPVVPIKGPGCASVRYLQGDQMAVTMSFGDRVLRNVTISGKKPKPVCMGLPGGISKFCGRIYGVSKEKDQFKACLGLELRALDDVEAALRVSCFKFGPQGINLEPGQPVPSSNEEKDDEDDEDDDDDEDDLLGGGDDDDDDEDDDDEEADDSENDVDSGDYTGFSALGDGFLETIFGGGEAEDEPAKKKKKKTSASVEQDAVVPVVPAASVVASSTAVPARKSNVTPATSLASKVTDTPQSVTPRDESSSVSAVSASDRIDEPVTSTSMSVSVVQKMEPAGATVLTDEEAEGTDKVMEVSSTAPQSGDSVESKEDDDDDDDDGEEEEEEDDLVDTAIKLVDDDDDEDDKKDDKNKDDEEDDDEDDENSEESNKVDSNSKLEESVLSSSASSVPSSTSSTVVKKGGVKKEDKKKENETSEKDEEEENSPAAILNAITTPLKSVTKTVTSTVAQTVASSLEDDKPEDDEDEEEDEARKIEADRQMRMAKILEVQERFKHKVYKTSRPMHEEPSRNSRQHKRMQLPTDVNMARRR